MKPEVIRSGTYSRPEGDDSRGFVTKYFADGSAIIVTERSICLVEKRAEYRVKSPGHDSE